MVDWAKSCLLVNSGFDKMELGKVRSFSLCSKINNKDLTTEHVWTDLD